MPVMGRHAHEIHIIIQIHGLNPKPPDEYGGDMPQLRISQGDTRMDALRPLIDGYADYLTSKENDPDYIQKVTRKCRKVCLDLGWVELSDISDTDLIAYLAKLREHRRSAKTRNHYRDAVCGWCSWMTRKGLLDRNPIELVPHARVTDEVERMVPTEDQVRALIDAASRDGRKGDRWLVYTIAAYTGLRKGEIEKLRVSMFRGGDNPRFVLPASVTKSRKVQEAFIPEWLAPQVAAHIADKALDDPVVTAIPKWESFERDRIKAKIPKQDEHGAVLSFHSLRHFFCNVLANAEVDQETRQLLMRHGSTRMTAHYTRTDAARLSKKVSQIGSSGVADDDDDGVESDRLEHTPMLMANGGGGSNPLTPISTGNNPQNPQGRGLFADGSASGVLATEEHADGQSEHLHGHGGGDIPQRREVRGGGDVSQSREGLHQTDGRVRSPRPLPHHDREDRPAQADDVTDSLSCEGEGAGASQRKSQGKLLDPHHAPSEPIHSGEAREGERSDRPSPRSPRSPMAEASGSSPDQCWFDSSRGDSYNHNAPASGSPRSPVVGVEPGAGHLHITQADFEREIGRAYLAGRRDGSAHRSTT